MPLKRHEHWHTRAFHTFLMERSQSPFEWGKNDCALFSADAIQSFTGVDIAADFRGKYTTELGSVRTIRKLTGGSSITDAIAYCATKYGLVEHQHPLMAQRGDLVLANDSGNLICGIVHLNGRHIAVSSDTGTRRLPITSIIRSWSV